MKRISPTTILIYLACVIALFGSGYKIGESRTIQSSSQKKSPQQNSAVTKTPQSSFTFDKDDTVEMGLFWETWKELEDKYADKSKLNADKMVTGAIKGMVASLEDPYTFFLTADENQKSKDDLGGKFEGIGAQLGLKNSRIVIVSPLKSSPAEKAGVKGGDYILEVDGKSTTGWSLTEAVNKIRGEHDTTVTLTLERSGKTVKLPIKRAQINVPSVELSTEKSKECKSSCKQVAYLKLNQFGDTTNDEWQKAVKTISQQWNDKKISGMVLDLRSNPGGYLESAVYLASEFLPAGKTIVKQQTSAGIEKEYTVERIGGLLTIPVTVILNEGSASASEILAGALRDYERAELVGMKSFGKGSVQRALDFSNGAGLHVTIAKWILPKGDWINGKGITPKTEVKNTIPEGETLTRDRDDQLEKAIDLLVQ